MALSQRVQILNGEFDPLTLEQTLDEVMGFAREGKRGWLCTVNVAILMMMREHRQLSRFVEKASFIVADGQPLVWAAPLFGKRLPERVTGVDLVEELCRRAAEEDVGVYFLGATNDVVSQVGRRFEARCPGLRVAGAADGYFPAEEAEDRARAVAESGAGILFVAMGVPRQEAFIEEQWEALGVNVAIGVGGSFDVLAGRRSRAPEVVQRVGLEWAYRLVQEPKRLFRRYLETNSRFIGLLGREVWATARRRGGLGGL